MNLVLERIRAALGSREAKAPYPAWAAEEVVSQSRLAHGTGSLTECFAANFRAVGGIIMRSVDEVAAYLEEANAPERLHGYCAPELADTVASRLRPGTTFSCDFDASRYDSYQFGITRATSAIAESGSIVLRDRETSDRLGALTPWIHIAVLDEQTIVRSIGDAIAGFGDDPNIIWVTGPSKTADVEGILIEGVHGPGVQIGLIL